MNTTNTATTKKMSIKMRRALCPHTNVITLADDVKVCTCCTAVLK